MIMPTTPPPVEAPPPPPPPRITPAPAYTGDSHSHLGYIALAIVLLLVGLAAGAAGGYFYAVIQQPASEQMADTNTMPEMQYQAEQTSDINANAGGDASTTNPLNEVQTNPFE